MRYFALALLAFVALTAVNAASSAPPLTDSQQAYLYQVGNCTELAQQSACGIDNDCINMTQSLYKCFKKQCFLYYNSTIDKIPQCFKQNCTADASNSQNSNIASLIDQYAKCVSSEVISFAFVLLITILSALFVQY